MRNLIKFLIRFKDFFLFLALQVLSLYFLFSENHYHNAIYTTSSNQLVGTMFEAKNNFREYLSLKENNFALAEENAELLSRQRSSYRRVDNEYLVVDDTLMKIQYTYVAAKVINAGTTKQKNYLTLNRGTLDGLAPNMAVIGPQGIVGIVRNASKHFSTVIPVINTSFELSIETKKTHDLGLLRWNGSNPQIASVEDMAKHAKISVGDSIVTRGSSAIFPPNMMVGIVERVEEIPGSNFHKIDVKLATSFTSLNYVYVIKNSLRNEQLELEKENE
jgi:rod shape-determining protein MreC